MARNSASGREYKVNPLMAYMVSLSSLFFLIHLFAERLGIEDINLVFNNGPKSMFVGMSSSLLSGILFVSLVHLFWFFGIHVSNVLEPVVQNLFVPDLVVNKSLADHGLHPTEIFTKQFFDIFVLLFVSGVSLQRASSPFCRFLLCQS